MGWPHVARLAWRQNEGKSAASPIGYKMNFGSAATS